MMISKDSFNNRTNFESRQTSPAKGQSLVDLSDALPRISAGKHCVRFKDKEKRTSYFPEKKPFDTVTLDVTDGTSAS